MRCLQHPFTVAKSPTSRYDLAFAQWFEPEGPHFQAFGGGRESITWCTRYYEQEGFVDVISVSTLHSPSAYGSGFFRSNEGQGW